MEQTSAQPVAEDAGGANQENAPAENANTNQPASGFETEATAPELAAMDEVHSELPAGSTAAANAESGADAEPSSTVSSDSDAAAATGENATEAVAAENPAGGTADSAHTSAEQTAETQSQSEAEQPAKKENVVVRKLKLNPNAKAPTPPAASLSGGSATATARQQEQPTQSTPAKTAPAPARSTAAPRAEDSSASDDAPIESMDFGAILQQFEQEQQEAQNKYREGTLVEGKIVSISERGVLIDFGYKAEGIVPQAEFMQDGAITVQPGDTTEIVVKRLDTPEGLPELSRAEAVKARTWDDLERASQDGTPVKGRVIDKVKGGLSVDINGIEAFLPGSQIESRPPRSLDGYQGQEIEARVIKFSRKRGNVVLSRKVLLDEVSGAQKAVTMQSLSEGFIVEGKVKSMTDYGAFVDLGGIDGLLHVTDMSWGKLDRPSDMYRVNDDVQVKVLKIDRDKERISLGSKQLIPNPWQSIEERY